MAVFWVTASSSLVEVYQLFRGAAASIIIAMSHSDDGSKNL
jgi:hypothetical protein